MNAAPLPFLPPDTDVRDLDGFMLNVERLLASELVAVGTTEECWAALMLWCRAWKQLPGGSLPNDDRILASFSGAGKRWSKVRGMALRGFVLCSDGRLYHRYLCDEVRRAYDRKLSYQVKRETDRQRLARWRKQRGGSEEEWESMRAEVFERDGNRCTKCGSEEDLHCDHIIPVSLGGATENRNLTTLCRGCHSRKTASQRRDEMHFTEHVVAEDTGQGQGHRDSEAIASGAVAPARPPADPVKDLWERGLAILGSGQRALLGKLRKAHGDPAVLAAIVACERENPSDPVSFFVTCCQRNSEPRHGQSNYDRKQSDGIDDRERGKALLRAAVDGRVDPGGSGAGFGRGCGPIIDLVPEHIDPGDARRDIHGA